MVKYSTIFAAAAVSLFAQTATAQLSCDESSDCPAGNVCTREWNRGIIYQLEAIGAAAGFGHCLDPKSSTWIDGPAIQADLDALDALEETAATAWDINGAGIPYRIPDRAEIRLDAPLTFRFRVLLEGNGARFRVQNDVSAMIVEEPYSKLEDFTIHAVSVTAPNTGVGIDVRAGAVRLYNLRISGMGTGIRAVDPDGPGPENRSLQRWRDVTVTTSDHYGVEINGNDANASLLEGLSLSGNAVGLFDGGFLGSTHVGIHLEQNAVGLRTDSGGSSRATFLGMYIENSDDIEMSAGSYGMTTVGGQLAARDGLVGDHIGVQRSHLVFQTSAKDYQSPEDEHTVRVEIPAVSQGQVGNRMAAMQFSYIFKDCDPTTMSCADPINFPRWKIDRRMDVGLTSDAWEIRPTVGNISRSTFGWSSDPAGNNVVPEIRRDPVCDYISATCTP